MRGVGFVLEIGLWHALRATSMFVGLLALNAAEVLRHEHRTTAPALARLTGAGANVTAQKLRGYANQRGKPDL